MTNYDKLRNVLLSLQQLGPAMWNQIDEALAALAELEKAAKEPVAWRYRYSDGKHSSAWLTNNNPPPAGDATVADVQLLYTTPPAPVAEIREPTEVTRPMCHGAWARFWSEPNTGDSCDQARRWLEAWRAELGPSLGLVEIREPTPEECERICTEYERLLMREGTCGGRDAFDAVRAVMWPKSEGS